MSAHGILTHIPWWCCSPRENKRLIAPCGDAVQQPALRDFFDNAELSRPGARLELSCSVHLLTTPEACQALHGDGNSTKGVSVLHGQKATKYNSAGEQSRCFVTGPLYA